ncbi:MAG: carbohydrate binding family 9 domain-containing protein, partial [Longimicrobiales bacterium]
MRCSSISSVKLLALLLSALPAAVAAQNAGEPAASLTVLVPHGEAPSAVAVRVAGGVQVDGVPTEAAWASAPVLTRFIQTDPDEGQPGTQRTEVRLLYDDEALYIGAMLYDSEAVTTRLARRDAGLPDSDFFIVQIDSYHDHQTAYRFAVNPSGVKQDGV